MSLQFIAGPSGSGKTYEMYRMLLDRSQKYPERNFILLVPEQYNMQAQRDIVLKSPCRGIMNTDVLSFTRLCHRIFDEAGQGAGVLLDDTGKSMVLRRVASQCSDSLGFMGSKMDREGYVGELKSLISEFIQYDISPEDVRDMAGRSRKKLLSAKLADIGQLYESFRDFLGDRYITGEEIPDRAMALAGEAPFLKDAEIYLDGYTGFTPVQLRFLSVMLRLCRRVVVTLTLDRNMLLSGDFRPSVRIDETALFALGHNTAVSLLELAASCGAGVEKAVTLTSEIPFRLRQFPALAGICSRIFRAGASKSLENSASKDGDTGVGEGIRIVRAPNIKAEAAHVCRSIHRLVREEGCSYSDIAVLTGDFSQYQDTFLTEAVKYDIPCFFDIRRRLTLNPLCELIDSLVEMTVNDLSYQSVFRFLRSPLSGFGSRETEEAENYVLAAGIRRKKGYFEPWHFLPRGYTPEDLEEQNRFRERFAGLIKPFAECFPPRKKVRCQQLVETLYHFIKELDVYGTLMSMSESFRQEGDIPRAEEYRQVYKKLMDVFDLLTEFMGDEMISVSQLGEILRAGLEELSVGILPPGTDEVLVGDMERSRISEVKYLFFMGVNDGLIPSDNRRGGILSELDRLSLKDMGVKLAALISEEAFIQRFYLYMYLSKASRGLYLSYSLMNAAGEALSPSYLIDEIRILGGGIQIEDALCDQERLLTEGEGLEYLARCMGEGGESSRGLFEYFARSRRYDGLLSQLTAHAFRRYKGDPISREAAKQLYSGIKESSISRLEKFASCPYAHFLQYGLRLSPRQEFSFESADMGSLCHEILRRYGRMVEERGIPWSELSLADCENLGREAVRSVIEGQRDAALFATARSAYMAERLRRIMTRVLSVITYQIQKGDFLPERFEYGFSDGILKGTIDRLDVYRSEAGIYLRIVDYKSSDHRFSLPELYDGVSLQLPVYAFEAREKMRRMNRGMQAEIAGMHYFHMDDPVLEESEDDSGESLDARRRREYKLRGLMVNDVSVLSHMDSSLAEGSDVISAKLKADSTFDARSEVVSREDMEDILLFSGNRAVQLMEEIGGGRIEARPYRRNKKEESHVCKYCRYASICGFDEYERGCEYKEAVQKDRAELMEIIRQTNLQMAHRGG